MSPTNPDILNPDTLPESPARTTGAQPVTSGLSPSARSAASWLRAAVQSGEWPTLVLSELRLPPEAPLGLTAAVMVCGARNVRTWRGGAVASLPWAGLDLRPGAAPTLSVSPYPPHPQSGRRLTLNLGPDWLDEVHAHSPRLHAALLGSEMFRATGQP